MPIKGLTDRATEQAIQQGRTVRLGTLSKGKREGFGKNIKLYDLDYLRFSPSEGFEKLAPVFEEVYGPQPKVIDDVRIPVGLAGNFRIEDCAWLTAGKHTERGSIFLARSDGEWVYQARGSDDGKVSYYEAGRLPFASVTKQDNRGADCFVFRGKLYPWQQTMTLDLILPEFNRAIFGAGAAGHGVVTLITHSTYDISRLIDEYHAMIQEIVSLLANPLRDDPDRVARFLPIRDFPIRLYRSKETISTPAFGQNAEPGDRVITKKSMLHWQLSPAMAAAMQDARDAKTMRMIEAVAYMHQLPAGNGDVVAKANADLFGDPMPKAQLQATNGSGRPVSVDLDEILTTDTDLDADDVVIEEGEVVEEGGAIEDYDWIKAATDAETLDGWAQAAYKLNEVVFENAGATKRAYTHIFGKFDPANNGAALASINLYAQQVADGVTKPAAVKAARDLFQAELVADEEE